jgi:hypothetical protein
MDEYTIGLSKYLYGHKVKLQTEFSDTVKNYSEATDNNLFVFSSRNWYLKPQANILHNT